MPRRLLIALAAFVMTLSAWAQEVPWTDKCARVHILTTKKELIVQTTEYSWFSGGWRDVENVLAQIPGHPLKPLSYEFIQFRAGHLVISQAEYAPDCQSFPEQDAEISRLRAKARTSGLTQDDFKGRRWIHLVKPIDLEEERCVAYGKINNRWQGCGDVWQGGLSDDKVVCFNGKNYPRCQVDCIKRIYNRQLELTDGYCAEVNP
jgi:hypothetical protein